jgi:hypothetical protein
MSQSFSGITDTIGSSTVPHVQNFLMKSNPGALILELVTGSDMGTVPVQIQGSGVNVMSGGNELGERNAEGPRRGGTLMKGRRRLFRFCISACSILLSAFLLALTCSALDNQVGCGNEPLYSRHGSMKGQIKSPNGQNELAIENLQDDKDPEGYVSFSLTVGEKHFSARLSGWRTEVLWSPDSKAFAVNQTEGGGSIGQQAYIFYVEENGLRRVDVSPPVEKAFGSPVKCEVPVPPNTAIIQWLDSNRILVAAEVVPVSICERRGTFQTYELSLPDLEILHVYGQAESKRLFGDALGCELRSADDSSAKSWQK